MKEEKTIFIATPMYGGMCTSAYTQSLIHLCMHLIDSGYKVGFGFVQNESLITRARNALVYRFLQSGADFLLFIDADHRFDASDVRRMIEEDEDIICAIPPKKTINWPAISRAANHNMGDPRLFAGEFVINAAPGIGISKDEKFEILHGGTGLMLIKRSVFEKMQPHCNSYINNNSREDMENNIQIVEFFKTSIKDNVLLSEDYDFCSAWRQLGGKIYAAPWVKITHVGNHEFSGSWGAQFELIVKEIQSK